MKHPYHMKHNNARLWKDNKFYAMVAPWALTVHADWFHVLGVRTRWAYLLALVSGIRGET